MVCLCHRLRHIFPLQILLIPVSSQTSLSLQLSTIPKLNTSLQNQSQVTSIMLIICYWQLNMQAGNKLNVMALLERVKITPWLDKSLTHEGDYTPLNNQPLPFLTLCNNYSVASCPSPFEMRPVCFTIRADQAV